MKVQLKVEKQARNRAVQKVCAKVDDTDDDDDSGSVGGELTKYHVREMNFRLCACELGHCLDDV